MNKRQERLVAFYLGVLIFIYVLFLNSNSVFDTQDKEILKRNARNLFKNLDSTQYSLKIILPADGMPRSDNQLCHGKGIKPVGEVKIVKHLDFSKTEPFQFLKNYKNPCFYHNVTYLDGKHLEKPVLSFRCVPYFFIVGMPKSGTTDIWHGIEQHPGAVIKHLKEPMYFNRRRYPKANWILDQYLDHFHDANNIIERSPSPDIWNGDKLYYYLITGEGTVDVSHDNNRWQEVPGNEGCNEPQILNSHYLHHLNPKMKLIFMMRNPIDRVFSDYLYESQFFGYNKTVEDFHVAVLESMANHMTCRKYFTERGCAYNSTLESFKARLRVGMYYIFLEDWYRVFPKDQIMVIKFEDFIRNRIDYLKKVFTFLDLRPITVTEEIKQNKRNIPNTRSKKDRKIGDMLRRTRILLSEFYAPFNKRLSYLLNDDKFMWKS